MYEFRTWCTIIVVGGGISNYTDDPARAGESLTTCLRQAQSHVPVAHHSSTPMWLGATAGMRLLRSVGEGACVVNLGWDDYEGAIIMAWDRRVVFAGYPLQRSIICKVLLTNVLFPRTHARTRAVQLDVSDHIDYGRATVILLRVSSFVSSPCFTFNRLNYFHIRCGYFECNRHIIDNDLAANTIIII